MKKRIICQDIKNAWMDGEIKKEKDENGVCELNNKFIEFDEKIEKSASEKCTKCKSICGYYFGRGNSQKCVIINEK